jgi:hypothetical protein
MKKVFSLALAVAITFAGKAHALIGGPFDNGNYNSALERSGIYQATFSFKNGNGFAAWTPENALKAASATSTSGTNAFFGSASSSTTGTSALNVNNRSVIYYKGFIFLGMATGMTDLVAGKIQGYTNGTTEYSTTQTATQASLFGSTTTNTNIPITFAGGNSFVATSSFTAKVTNRSPSITFKGTGQISFLSPDNASSISKALQTYTTTLYQGLATQASTTLSTLSTSFITNQIPPSVTLTVSNASTTDVNVYTAGTPGTSNYILITSPRGGTTITFTPGPPPVTTSTPSPSTITVTPPPALITQYGTSATASASNPDPGSLQYIVNGLTQLQDGTLKNLNSLNANATAAITAALTPPTLEQETKNTENFKMTVYGSLKYL